MRPPFSYFFYFSDFVYIRYPLHAALCIFIAPSLAMTMMSEAPKCTSKSIPKYNHEDVTVHLKRICAHLVIDYTDVPLAQPTLTTQPFSHYALPYSLLLPPLYLCVDAPGPRSRTVNTFGSFEGVAEYHRTPHLEDVQLRPAHSVALPSNPLRLNPERGGHAHIVVALPAIWPRGPWPASMRLDA